MSARLLAVAPLALACALLTACPDTAGPKVPTVPKVPEPKAQPAPPVQAGKDLLNMIEDRT